MRPDREPASCVGALRVSGGRQGRDLRTQGDVDVRIRDGRPHVDTVLPSRLPVSGYSNCVGP